MGQFYARVFVQILDSSIAEDFMVRHVFEDMLKVCDMGGVVDMTRTAMSRRFNVPLQELARAIEKLEAPDPSSRDKSFAGRRLERLDEHRDWGWRILNWAKYESIRTRADVSVRVARHRARKELAHDVPTESTPGTEEGLEKNGAPETPGGGGGTVPPLKRVRGTNRPATLEAVLTAGQMLGVLEPECKRFWDYYEGTAKEDENGNPVWVTGEKGEKVVGNWRNVLGTWKANADERAAKQKAGNGKTPREAVRESAGTFTMPPIVEFSNEPDPAPAHVAP